MTYYFLRGLQGDADANGDKKITLVELYDYLKPRVVRQAHKDGRPQEPQLQKGRGENLGLWRGEALAELR